MGGVWGDVWWGVWWGVELNTHPLTSPCSWAFRKIWVGVGVFFVILLFFRKKKLRHDTFAAAELIICVHFVL